MTVDYIPVTVVRQPPVYQFTCRGFDPDTEEECGARRLVFGEDPEPRACWKCGDV